MKVLFIAYYLDPAISPGAHRISYWANNLSKLGTDVSTEIITAFPGSRVLEAVKAIHVVPNNKRNSNIGIADAGYTWKGRLLKHIKSMDFNFDCVIMSGGPFMQFGIAKFLKETFGVKIMLDFRDPFARNPRFNNSFLKIAIKSYYERQFIKYADLVVTVNDECLTLLKYNEFEDDRYAIIENGYDDSILDDKQFSPERSSVISTVYSGSFFDDRNPTTFLKILGADQFKDHFSFTHIGRESAFVTPFLKGSNIHELDLMEYGEMADKVAQADLGLIFTSGNAFESTSKIFDYIGLSRAILIITEGGLRTGNLHKITENYPKVYWSKNDKDSIEKVLNQIREEDLHVSFPERESYSRKAGVRKLGALLNIKLQ